MKNLILTLENLRDKATNQIKGGDVNETTLLNDANSLRVDFLAIKEISDRNKKIVWIIIVLLLFLFFSCVYITYYYINKGELETLKIIFATTGISFGGLIYYLNYLWRQIVGIEFALAVYERLDSNALLAIINSLLSTFNK